MTIPGSLRRRSLAAALMLGALALLPAHAPAQIATGKSKFVGNVIAASPPSNFATYWNQVTPENSSKWGSVEATRNMSASQMATALNAYAATGLDIYISELDITGGGSDAGQLAKYQELFPVMWNHASVKGITL